MPTALLFGRAASSRDDFDVEAEAAEALQLDSYAVDLQALLDGDEARALATLPRRPQRLLYRGWMLTVEERVQLHEALEARGHSLRVTPLQYEAAHRLPAWYPRLVGYTARSRWTHGPHVEDAWALLPSLGPGPWLLKDHVKSAKEHWHEACFVPTDCTRARFGELCERLLEVRGERFEGGFVLRRWLPFQPFGQTPTGPAFLEYRLFFGRGRLVAAAPYFDFDVETPDFTAFERLARRIDSPFFCMDLAQLESGDFAVVELNDGGVSMLPAAMDPRELFGGLARVGLL
jgi:hypothetical protein